MRQQLGHDSCRDRGHGRLAAASLRHIFLLDAGPELVFADQQLVAQDVRPHAQAVGLTVWWMRDSGAQYLAVGKSQLEGDVVAALAPCVANQPPPLVEAEILVIFSRRLTETGHRCSQSRSSS